MRSGGLLLRVRAALRPAVGRALAVALAAALLVPAPAVASSGAPAATQSLRDPAAAPLPPPPGTTSLVSRDRKGDWANDGSVEPSMSDNGRWVAFTSKASDLVAGGGTGSFNVFIRDRRSGKTTKVPPPGGVLPAGGESSEPALSGNGSVVAYTYTVTPGPTIGAVSAPTSYVVAYDRTTGVSDVVSARQGRPAPRSSQPAVSSNGRYVAFTSATDITGEDEVLRDVFRYDRRSESTVLVSTNPDGRPIGGNADSPSISGDGNLVAFVSDGGDSVTFENTGKGNQVFVRNVTEKVTTFESRSPGRSAPDGPAGEPALSGDGRYLAFSSSASNLVTSGPAGGPGVFRRELATGDTILVSVTPTGGVAQGSTGQPSITPDGRMVAFASSASDLAPATAAADAHLAAIVTRLPVDVYLRDISVGETILISVTTDGRASRDDGARSFQPSVAGNGRYVAFASNGNRILDDDPNNTYDVFLRDLPPVPVLTPPTLDLGAGAVGTTSAPGAATLANAGWTPLSVTKASITGGDKGDFKLVADGCAGRQLRRNEACTVSVIFTPKAKGTRTSTLAIADSHTGSPRTVRLRGRASQAKLRLSPEIGPPGHRHDRDRHRVPGGRAGGPALERGHHAGPSRDHR